jgi:hypothetical protein
MANTTGTSSQILRAKELIDSGRSELAIPLLTATLKDDATGESLALLGLIYFLREEYPVARSHLAAALQVQPDRTDWHLLHIKATANAEASIDVPIPPLAYFKDHELMGQPRPGVLPLVAPEVGRQSLVSMLLRVLGSAAGEAITQFMAGSTELVGRIVGYRDEVWTNWYRRNAVMAILTLAYMRNRLNARNLFTTYPTGRLVGFQAEGQKPPTGVLHYRTADGSWNNLADPKEGAAGTRFPRNVNPARIRPEGGVELLTPNPRVVSKRLLSRHGKMKEVPFLNLLAAIWINFENHDWISHGENLTPEILEIPLSDDDPARTLFRQRALLVGRTQQDPTRKANGEPAPLTFINEVTHWWDGSQIYGSDEGTLNRLRSHTDGQLRLSEDGKLPLDAKGVEDTGFRRNWWVGLSAMHLLFVKEHNAICDMLKGAYPEWGDDRLFNVARLVNAAVMAKIHSIEWTPAILPNRILSDGLNANWYGLLTNAFRRGKGKKTVAAINIRNPEMGGVVGNPIDKHGKPFGLTEEFVEVYRLHSLLPESLAIRTIGKPETVEDVPFPQSRQAGSPKITGRYSMADLLFSFGNQHPGQLVLNNFPAFLQELSLPGNPLFDLGAVDIFRARERGVPRYNEFRRQLGLNPIRSFEDLTDNPDDLSNLRDVYGNDAEAIERLDLMVGTLAETHRPSGFGFGETLFQIFILNATRRLQADRFYTDCYNAETYTKEGLAWIDEATLKKVLLRHYPELAQTGLANVKNAFEPWDTGQTLDPSRHPLRAFDREITTPWRGDAYR